MELLDQRQFILLNINASAFEKRERFTNRKWATDMEWNHLWQRSQKIHSAASSSRGRVNSSAAASRFRTLAASCDGRPINSSEEDDEAAVDEYGVDGAGLMNYVESQEFLLPK
jgi:hypothetical protein